MSKIIRKHDYTHLYESIMMEHNKLQRSYMHSTCMSSAARLVHTVATKDDGILRPASHLASQPHAPRRDQI
jgi:hypothetical protein